MPSLNRESWLTETAKLVAPLFTGFKIPPHRLTCGWPCTRALSRKLQRVGECHGAKSSKGGVFEIFISPVLEDSLQVAGTLCHELAHVIAGIEAQHKGAFLEVCKHVGLTKGKPTSVMPGQSLEARIQELIHPLGPYPHSALTPLYREVRKSPKRVTLYCPCGNKAILQVDWLLKTGNPLCGCGEEFDLVGSAAITTGTTRKSQILTFG